MFPPSSIDSVVVDIMGSTSGTIIGPTAVEVADEGAPRPDPPPPRLRPRPLPRPALPDEVLGAEDEDEAAAAAAAAAAALFPRVLE